MSSFDDSILGFVETEKCGLAISNFKPESDKGIYIEFKDLYDYDENLANELILNPIPCLISFDSLLTNKLRMRNPDYSGIIEKISARIRGLPNSTLLRNVSADQIGQLIMIKGIVVKSTEIKPYCIDAVFECPSCGADIHIEQIEEDITPPAECVCQNRRGFKIKPDKSEFIDIQRITIQENPNELPAGQIPRSISIELKQDLVEKARPGDNVNVVGYMRLYAKRGRLGGLNRSFDFIITANNVEVQSYEDDVFEITDADIEKIHELSKDPLLLQKLTQTLAPSLFGIEIIKEAALYVLFRGVRKSLPDVEIRGDISVLMVGDPGTGKSQLLVSTKNVAHRAVFTTGRGSSAAGLTAAVVKDKDEGFVLEAGALVLADQGICLIDEMDKMRDEDRGAIHPAMEQQVVSIAKGGIVATLNARTSIFASANPHFGRYNPYQTIAENLGKFPVTLLNRFDLIFVLRDIPDKERDAKLADHILASHDATVTHETPIDPKFLRKYIIYSQKIIPNITDEVKSYLRDFYVKMRSSSVQGGKTPAISISARQLESLIRISEARARMRLSETVSEADAEASVAIMNRSLEQVGIDVSTGEIDIDLLYSGKPRSLQMQLQTVLSLIDEMSRIEGMVKDEQLYESLSSEHNIGRTDAAKFIGVLMKDGTIYSPRPGYYRKTS